MEAIFSILLLFNTTLSAVNGDGVSKKNRKKEAPVEIVKPVDKSAKEKEEKYKINKGQEFNKNHDSWKNGPAFPNEGNVP